jgi:hypothetical protein
MTLTMLMALAAMSGTAQAEDTLPGWLAGDWACRGQMLAGGPIWRSEIWERDDWSGLTGVVRGGQQRAGSALAEISLARILDGGDGLVLSYSEGSGPVREFRAVEIGANAIVFQAGDGGTPGRIAYRRDPFSFTVTHSRRDGSDARTWRYARAGIHTGAPEC